MLGVSEVAEGLKVRFLVLGVVKNTTTETNKQVVVDNNIACIIRAFYFSVTD